MNLKGSTLTHTDFCLLPSCPLFLFKRRKNTKSTEERSSTRLIIREWEIKIITWYIPSHWSECSSSKDYDSNNEGGLEGERRLLPCLGECKLVIYMSRIKDTMEVAYNTFNWAILTVQALGRVWLWCHGLQPGILHPPSWAAAQKVNTILWVGTRPALARRGSSRTVYTVKDGKQPPCPQADRRPQRTWYTHTPVVVKKPPAGPENIRVWTLGWEDALEEVMATLSSNPEQRIPRTEEPGGLQSIRSQRVRGKWSDSA